MPLFPSPKNGIRTRCSLKLLQGAKKVVANRNGWRGMGKKPPKIAAEVVFIKRTINMDGS